MNVLSLFNGMGCIWIALDELGIDVTARYSSEIDKYACQVNDHNYPDNYTKVVSRTQATKMLGNGWTVPVISHILEPLNPDNDAQ